MWYTLDQRPPSNIKIRKVRWTSHVKRRVNSTYSKASLKINYYNQDNAETDRRTEWIMQITRYSVSEIGRCGRAPEKNEDFRMLKPTSG